MVTRPLVGAGDVSVSEGMMGDWPRRPGSIPTGGSAGVDSVMGVSGAGLGRARREVMFECSLCLMMLRRVGQSDLGIVRTGGEGGGGELAFGRLGSFVPQRDDDSLYDIRERDLFDD